MIQNLTAGITHQKSPQLNHLIDLETIIQRSQITRAKLYSNLVSSSKLFYTTLKQQLGSQQMSKGMCNMLMPIYTIYFCQVHTHFTIILIQIQFTMILILR